MKFPREVRERLKLMGFSEKIIVGFQQLRTLDTHQTPGSEYWRK